MRFGSLFAGIGGFDLGLERAGMTCAWQVEIDDYATKVLEKHWPEVPRFRDVRECGAYNLEPVELICGGFPCQDISNAGQRIGIDGARSGLWSEYARIVRELRPRVVFVENVSALLVRGIDVVLGDLSSLGYDAEWDCVPAQAVGAPHVRDRVWIVATRRGVSDPVGDVLRIEWERVRQQHQEPRQAKSRDDGDAGNAPDADGNHGNQGRMQEPARPEAGHHSERRGWWSVEPGVCGVAYGVPERLDRLRCLGNAVVPQIVEHIGRAIMTYYSNNRERDDDG